MGLLSTLVSWDMCISRDGDSLFSGPHPHDWPVFIVKKCFPDTSWEFAGVAICIQCPFTVCLWGKSLFQSSWYLPITQVKTAVNSVPARAPQSSLLQAKQTKQTGLAASLHTSCAPARGQSWCPSAGSAAVCRCLSCTGEPKTQTQLSQAWSHKCWIERN